MSIGPLGALGASAAGSPLAQTKGSDVERAQDDTGAQKRREVSEKKAENASGIGEADGEDHEAADRDADGRRLWENSPESSHADDAHGGTAPSSQRQSKDTTGQSGNLIDLSG
jgi:hypothetical protein